MWQEQKHCQPICNINENVQICHNVENVPSDMWQQQKIIVSWYVTAAEYVIRYVEKHAIEKGTDSWYVPKTKLLTADMWRPCQLICDNSSKKRQLVCDNNNNYWQLICDYSEKTLSADVWWQRISCQLICNINENNCYQICDNIEKHAIWYVTIAKINCQLIRDGREKHCQLLCDSSEKHCQLKCGNSKKHCQLVCDNKKW